MQDTHAIGIDPGLVHTGVVRMLFEPRLRIITVSHEAVVGPDAQAVAAWVAECPLPARIFIEGYRPRAHFNSDPLMIKALHDLRLALPNSIILNNTGVKKVVRRPLMDLVGVWSFPTLTHHQDLRSAGRIALLGMLKDEELNQLLATIVRDHLDGRTWTLIH